MRTDSFYKKFVNRCVTQKDRQEITSLVGEVTLNLRDLPALENIEVVNGGLFLEKFTGQKVFFFDNKGAYVGSNKKYFVKQKVTLRGKSFDRFFFLFTTLLLPLYNRRQGKSVCPKDGDIVFSINDASVFSFIEGFGLKNKVVVKIKGVQRKNKISFVSLYKIPLRFY